MEESLIDLFGFDMPDPEQLNGIMLAYIGDAVYEVIIRGHAMSAGSKRADDTHRRTTDMVNAGAQAYIMNSLFEKLSEEEMNVFRRGRNSRVQSIAKNQSMADYRKATGFEALIGYLYLKGRTDRIKELLLPVIEEERSCGSISGRNKDR